MSILEFLNKRISHWVEQREIYRLTDKHKTINSKLYELYYLRQSMKRHKFSPICPNCQGRLLVLTTKYPTNEGLKISGGPVVWPHSESGKGNYQQLTLQVVCPDCKKYYNVKYIFDSVEEVTDPTGIWKDLDETVDNWRTIVNKAKESTRRRLLDGIKGFLKKFY